MSGIHEYVLLLFSGKDNILKISLDKTLLICQINRMLYIDTNIKCYKLCINIQYTTTQLNMYYEKTSSNLHCAVHKLDTCGDVLFRNHFISEYYIFLCQQVAGLFHLRTAHHFLVNSMRYSHED